MGEFSDTLTFDSFMLVGGSFMSENETEMWVYSHAVSERVLKLINERKSNQRESGKIIPF